MGLTGNEGLRDATIIIAHGYTLMALLHCAVKGLDRKSKPKWCSFDDICPIGI